MLSPTTLAELQDVLDSVNPPLQTRNGELTVDDIRRLRKETEREVTQLDPTPPAENDTDVDGNRPLMDPDATATQQQSEV